VLYPDRVANCMLSAIAWLNLSLPPSIVSLISIGSGEEVGCMPGVNPKDKPKLVVSGLVKNNGLLGDKPRKPAFPVMPLSSVIIVPPGPT
jgi:hypothetical protein